jgi:hypothetical protein
LFFKHFNQLKLRVFLLFADLGQLIRKTTMVAVSFLSNKTIKQVQGIRILMGSEKKEQRLVLAYRRVKVATKASEKEKILGPLRLPKLVSMSFRLGKVLVDSWKNQKP